MIAKKLPCYTSSNMGSLQYHGAHYLGPMQCKPCIDATPRSRRGYALTYVDRMRLSHRRPAHRKLECGTDCFACPGRTSLASDQVCRANGCQNFYSLTQAECENFKTLNLGQTCPGGGFKGLSHFGAHSRRSRGAATSASILKTTRGPAEGAGRPERRPRIRRRTSLRSLLFPSPWRKFSPFPVEASGGAESPRTTNGPHEVHGPRRMSRGRAGVVARPRMNTPPSNELKNASISHLEIIGRCCKVRSRTDQITGQRRSVPARVKHCSTISLRAHHLGPFRPPAGQERPVKRSRSQTRAPRAGDRWPPARARRTGAPSRRS